MMMMLLLRTNLVTHTSVPQLLVEQQQFNKHLPSLDRIFFQLSKRHSLPCLFLLPQALATARNCDLALEAAREGSEPVAALQRRHGVANAASCAAEDVRRLHLPQHPCPVQRWREAYSAHARRRCWSIAPPLHFDFLWRRKVGHVRCRHHEDSSAEGGAKRVWQPMLPPRETF